MSVGNAGGIHTTDIYTIYIYKDISQLYFAANVISAISLCIRLEHGYQWIRDRLTTVPSPLPCAMQLFVACGMEPPDAMWRQLVCVWNAAPYQQSDNLRKTTDWQLKDNSRHSREEGMKRDEEVENGGRDGEEIERKYMATVATFAKPIYHN